MATLPAEVLAGLSYGTVAGALSAAIVGVGSFALRRFRGRELPHTLAAVAALAIAAGNVVAIGIFDPATLLDGNTGAVPRLVVGGAVVAVLGLYGASQGRAVADSIPRGTSLPTDRKQRLSETVLDAIDSAGQVQLTVADDIRDIEGYPAPSPEVRDEIAGSVWQLPADLPIPALESRLAERLKSTYGFAEVRVTISPRGEATVAAAAPTGSLAHSVPDGQRAVTVETVIPTGVAPGDVVRIVADGGTVRGTVLETALDGGATTAGQSSAQSAVTGQSPGGSGTVTISVDTTAAGDLLETTSAAVVVDSQGTNHALAALSHLEDTDLVVRKFTVDDWTRSVLVDNAERIRLLALRRPGAPESAGGWQILPGTQQGSKADVKANGDTPDQSKSGTLQKLLQPGATVFVAGPEGVLRTLDDEQASTAEVVPQ